MFRIWIKRGIQTTRISQNVFTKQCFIGFPVASFGCLHRTKHTRYCTAIPDIYHGPSSISAKWFDDVIS